jgi:hypothetical protein
MEELSDVRYQGIELAETVERLWAFAAGMPLRHSGFGLHLVPVEPPKGWLSNAEDLDELLQRERGGYIVRSVGGGYKHWRSSDHFPLRALLAALRAWPSADSMVKEIVELHYEAAMSSTRDGHHVLLSKGLEIVRALLPGRDDRRRQKHLPKEVQEHISHDLHWFFGIANNRLNTRHPVSGGTTPTLQPPMTGPETMAFLREADLILRGVACERLGLDIVAINY